MVVMVNTERRWIEILKINSNLRANSNIYIYIYIFENRVIASSNESCQMPHVHIEKNRLQKMPSFSNNIIIKPRL